VECVKQPVTCVMTDVPEQKHQHYPRKRAKQGEW
jgi:hypothetical protein